MWQYSFTTASHSLSGLWLNNEFNPSAPPAAASACLKTPFAQLVLGLPRRLGPAGYLGLVDKLLGSKKLCLTMSVVFRLANVPIHLSCLSNNMLLIRLAPACCRTEALVTWL